MQKHELSNYKVALAAQRLKLPPKKFCDRRDATQILNSLILNTYISEILRQAFFGKLLFADWEKLGTIGNNWEWEFVAET